MGKRARDQEIPEAPQGRAAEIMNMLASIPIDEVRETAIELLQATRWVNMGRDRDPKQEPDNAVRLRMVELIVTQGAGAAPKRKEAPAEGPKEEPRPGLLKAKG